MMWNTKFAFALVLLGYGAELVSALSGQVTWYSPNQYNHAGACGQMHYDNEFVVAVASGGFDAFPGATGNPNTNPICKKTIKATYQGKSVCVRVVDRCGDCPSASNLDMSPTAFQILAPSAVGRLSGVTWEYTTEAPGPCGGGGGGSTVDGDVQVDADAQVKTWNNNKGKGGNGSWSKKVNVNGARRSSSTDQGSKEDSTSGLQKREWLQKDQW